MTSDSRPSPAWDETGTGSVGEADRAAVRSNRPTYSSDLTPEVTQAFEREERYIVIKRKHLPDEIEDNLRAFLNGRNRDDWQFETVECVVVESDWPEYETVWKMIEAGVTGTAAPPAHERRSTPEEKASALAHGHALDAEDGGYPAHESRVPTDQVERVTGYSDAFYAIGKMLGIPAQDKSPAEVWATQMQPMLERAIATFNQAIPSGVDGLVDARKACENCGFLPEVGGPE